MVSFEEMFKRHAPKIRRVAVRLSRGFGGQQQVDELAAVGSVALWQCYQRFDAERMPEDAFWAYSNKRVQGAMLDTLRRQGHGGRAGQRMVKEDDLGDTPWALIPRTRPALQVQMRARQKAGVQTSRETSVHPSYVCD